jgi:uncharacterized sulfatase
VRTKGAASPHEALILFDNEVPIGVRTQAGSMSKRLLPRPQVPDVAARYEQLYDLSADPSENYSVADHPRSPRR